MPDRDEIHRIAQAASRSASARGAKRQVDDAYWRLVLHLRLDEMKAIDAWLDRCIKTA